MTESYVTMAKSALYAREYLALSIEAKNTCVRNEFQQGGSSALQERFRSLNARDRPTLAILWPAVEHSRVLSLFNDADRTALTKELETGRQASFFVPPVAAAAPGVPRAAEEKQKKTRFAPDPKPAPPARPETKLAQEPPARDSRPLPRTIVPEAQAGVDAMHAKGDLMLRDLTKNRTCWTCGGHFPTCHQQERRDCSNHPGSDERPLFAYWGLPDVFSPTVAGQRINPMTFLDAKEQARVLAVLAKSPPAVKEEYKHVVSTTPILRLPAPAAPGAVAGGELCPPPVDHSLDSALFG